MNCQYCNAEIETYETHGLAAQTHHCEHTPFPPAAPDTKYPGLRDQHRALFGGHSDFMIERRLGEYHKISTDSLVAELNWRGYRVRLET